MPGKPDRALASMGIYIFNARYLYRALERDMADPDVQPRLRQGHHSQDGAAGLAVGPPVRAELRRRQGGGTPYWRDVGTIDAYWDANIDLTATDPLLNLYDTQWPIWTYQPQLPPAKFVHNQDDRRGMAIESMVSGGCIVSGTVFRSVLFSRCACIRTPWSTGRCCCPGVQVGRHARVTRAVVDRDCMIPDGMVIGEDAAADAARFFRTELGHHPGHARHAARTLARCRKRGCCTSRPRSSRWSRPAAWPMWWRPAGGAGRPGRRRALLLPGLPPVLEACSRRAP
jgi:glucose-1-phosphate adenylyltransferase